LTGLSVCYVIGSLIVKSGLGFAKIRLEAPAALMQLPAWISRMSLLFCLAKYPNLKKCGHDRCSYGTDKGSINHTALINIIMGVNHELRKKDRTT
jgi:hypothetical protein